MWNIQKIVGKGDYLYAKVPDHPNSYNGYVLAHRVIMENHLGRLLDKNEVVHHIDGNKKNNSIDNLRVMTNVEHAKLHQHQHGELYVKLKCPSCGKEFEIPKRQSFLVKHNKYNCNCCSKHCRGVLYREIQLHGLTPTLESAISENLLAEYRKYKYTDEDNSEETDLQQDP